jgi:hypothetical protein
MSITLLKRYLVTVLATGGLASFGIAAFSTASSSAREKVQSGVIVLASNSTGNALVYKPSSKPDSAMTKCIGETYSGPVSAACRALFSEGLAEATRTPG